MSGSIYWVMATMRMQNAIEDSNQDGVHSGVPFFAAR